MYKVTSTLLSFIILCAAAHADAHDSLAKAALAEALADISARLQRLAPTAAIGYTATVTDRNGRSLQQYYAVAPEAIGHTPTPPRADAVLTPQISWTPSAFALASHFDPEAAVLVDSTDTGWVFRLPSQVRIGIDTADASQGQALAASVNANLLETLTREIVVTKQYPRIISQRIYARHPFHPTWLARVDKFVLRIEYQEAWPGGPWVHHIRTREVAGRYALFAALDEFEETVLGEFSLQTGTDSAPTPDT
jgi:hypothetical protein